MLGPIHEFSIDQEVQAYLLLLSNGKSSSQEEGRVRAISYKVACPDGQTGVSKFNRARLS